MTTNDDIEAILAESTPADVPSGAGLPETVTPDSDVTYDQLQSKLQKTGEAKAAGLVVQADPNAIEDPRNATEEIDWSKRTESDVDNQVSELQLRADEAQRELDEFLAAQGRLDEVNTHRVAPGQTSRQIAKLYGLRHHELQKFNPSVKNMRHLVRGQILRVKAARVR